MKWRFKRSFGSHIELDSYFRPSTTRAMDAFLFIMALFATVIVAGDIIGINVFDPNPTSQQSSNYDKNYSRISNYC